MLTGYRTDSVPDHTNPRHFHQVQIEKYKVKDVFANVSDDNTADFNF